MVCEPTATTTTTGVSPCSVPSTLTSALGGSLLMMSLPWASCGSRVMVSSLPVRMETVSLAVSSVRAAVMVCLPGRSSSGSFSGAFPAS
jgi:hypothetical protein